MSRNLQQGFLDHTMHNKLEMGPQRNPSSCPQKASAEEFFTYKSYTNYSLPTPSAHNSASPWGSATAYLQYAGSALNQHLRTDRGICYRNEVEGTDNILRPGSQLLETTENNFQVQQHNPGLSYPLSPQGCPTFAMPRPMYRSPTSYMEYDTLALPFGIQPGFQQIPSLAAEQNPCFAYPSSHLSSTKNKPHYSGPLEVGSTSHCFSQGLQDQSQQYKQRDYANSSLQIPRSQGEILKDCYPSLNHNVQMTYNQAYNPGELQRNPKFIPSHQHQTYKSSAFYSNMGDVYSMSHHLIRDVYADRPSPFGCSIDKARLPNSVKEMTMFTDRGVRVSTEHRKMEQGVNESVKEESSQIQVENELCKDLKNVAKDLQLGMGKGDKEHMYDTSQEDKVQILSSRNSEKGIEWVGSLKDSFVQKAIQSPHRSVYPHIKNLHPASAHSTDVQESGQENSVSQVLGSEIRFKTPAPCGPSDKKLDLSPAKECLQKSNIIEGTQRQVLQASSLQVTSENQTSEDNNSHHPEAASSSANLINSEVDENDGRSSPPMPVINDVFSLAPYREYLEGTAPHPFPTQRESTRDSQLPSPHTSPQMNRPHDFEKRTPSTPTLDSNYKPPISDFCLRENKCDITVQATDCKKASVIHAEERVLDLSLKKSLDSVNPSQGSNTAYTPVVGSPQKSADSIVSKMEAGSTMASMNCSMQATSSSTSPKTSESSFLQEIGGTNSSQVTAKNTALMPNISCSSQTSAGNNPLFYSTSGSSQSPHHMFSINCSSPVAAGSTRFMNHSSQDSLGSNSIMSSMVCSSQVTGSNPLITSMTSSSTAASDNIAQLTTTSCFSQTSAGNTNSLSSMSSFLPAMETSPRLMSSMSRSSQVAAGSTPFVSSTSQASVESNPLMASMIYSPEVTGSTSLITSMNSSSQATAGCATTITSLSSSSHGTVQCTPLITSQCFSSKATSTSSPKSDSPCFPNTNQALNICPTLNIVLPISKCYDFSKTQVPKFILPNNNSLCSSSASVEPSENTEWRKRPHTDISQVSPNVLENENSFHSSKTFMFKKYKMMKLPSTGGETQGEASKPSSHTLPVPVHSPPEGAHSLPPSAPESSPTLGEANVSLATDGAPLFKGSRKHFTELHKRLCTTILNSVAISPLGVLQDLLTKNMEKERPKSPVKVKSSSRSIDPLKNSQHHNLWLDIDGVRLALHKLLSLLETFMFTRICPFPHVIRAGAIFIPIYLVKEILYPELLGTSIDRVLQSHKVELRPTTLSEVKALRETELKDCPSRMLKLLALKQLPDVYPDLVHLYWEDCIQKQIGSHTQSGLLTPK
ncbi:serine-rich adhesin for platelets isoform X2 [Xenopus laevis]|uniref:Serine-rich adhesin for platelets isoform X2 n=1 Tax=Xenopus laevis TaxID=8355 RepID=A0A8J0UQU2_XENLA|nr:serine-rich adhesin for platelets isoform X2 [Xenopus laevis]